MPDTLSPAEVAIQEADKAREEFFGAASSEFDRITTARTAAINPLGDKLPKTISTADPVDVPPSAADHKPGASSGSGHTPRQPTGSTPVAPAKVSPQDTGPNASASAVKVPGPPQAAPAPAPVPADAGGQSASAGTAGQPAADDPEIPSADAFDSGPNRPQTTHWRKLHASKDAWVAKAQAAEKRLAELEASRTAAAPAPEVQEQLKHLQQERDTLLARLEAVAVEKSPRFEAAFKPRIEAAINTAKQVVGPDKADAIAKLLEMPEGSWRDQQIESVIQDMGPSSLRALKLTQAVADLDRVAAERQALSQQGSQLYKQWQHEEQQAIQRQQQERVQSATRVFESVVSDWKRAGADLDDTSVSLARDVFMGQRDLNDIATAAMWVAVGPKAAANALKLQNRVAELEAELSRLKSAAPGNASDAGSTNSPMSDDIPTDSGYGDAIARMALQQGLLRQ